VEVVKGFVRDEDGSAKLELGKGSVEVALVKLVVLSDVLFIAILPRDDGDVPSSGNSSKKGADVAEAPIVDELLPGDGIVVAKAVTWFSDKDTLTTVVLESDIGDCKFVEATVVMGPLF